MPASHPFLATDFTPRWSDLTPAAARVDIPLALRRAAAAVDTIAGQDRSALTFAGTFLALERATEELNVAWGKVGHLLSVADSPEWREANRVLLPEVTAFLASIPLRADLWECLRAFAAGPEAAALGGIHRRLMEETLRDFRQAGADQPPAVRGRLERLQAELAQETQAYAECVLDATNAWSLVVTDERRLDGLPAQAKAAARENARARGLEGWRFTLQAPSQEPFLTHIVDEDLRRQLWTAAAAVGSQAPHDNTERLRRILALRAEKAALLGKHHFADLVLERRMARTGASALRFLEDLQGRAAAAFSRENRALEEFRSGRTGQPAGPLAPWEVAFWAERLRRERHAFDEEALRPYFPLPQVLGGLFELVRRVFGLRVLERPGGAVETWHPEVRFYDVNDESGRHLGSFYADWHPRESKRGGAWMNYLMTGGPRADGARDPHLGLICGNLTPPPPGRSALLTHREVETVFHEFGHLLHHLLGEVEIKSLNGVNVAWDFVELPSQIMENWCWERESLDLFARHHETGALIPADVFARMQDARRFRAGAVTMRQLGFAKLDLLLHMRTEEFLAAPDLEAALRPRIADCLVPTVPPAPTIVRRFNHLFADPVGYAAGYYSYKWAEVLDADAFTRFRREGLFSRTVGRDFVTHILSRGNSADAGELYRGFMGRDPDLAALLERSGLAVAA